MSGYLTTPIQIAQIANVEKVAQAEQSHSAAQQQFFQAATVSLLKEQDAQVAKMEQGQKGRGIKAGKDGGGGRREFGAFQRRKKAPGEGDVEMDDVPGEGGCAPADSSDLIWSGNILNMKV